MQAWSSDSDTMLKLIAQTMCFIYRLSIYALPFMKTETREITPEDMIDYYFDLLKYTKKQNHRDYMIHMIGYFCGSLPMPPASVRSKRLLT